MKKVILLTTATLIGLALQATSMKYSVMAEKIDLDGDTVAIVDTVAYAEINDYGDIFQNLSNYRRLWVEPYINFGFILGDIKGSDAQFLYGESYNVDLGFKWRYQATKNWAFIVNTAFAYNHYEINDGFKNDIFKFAVDLDPTNYSVNREFYRSWAFGLGLGARYNFDGHKTKLGGVNYKKPGKYIELVGYGNYNYSRYYDLEYYGPSNLELELQYKDNSLFYPFEAGVQASLGWNWINVWGRYRLTDCFYSKYSNSQLPAFSVGLGLLFF